MSAFVCILDRSGCSLDPKEIHRLAEPLAAYGDAVSSLCRGPVAIAIRHTGAPADPERCGPLNDPATGLVAAMAGRLRGMANDAAPGERDAAPASSGEPPALRAMLRDDGRLLRSVCGSFVLITADPGQAWMSIARDHLGDLKVYYHLDRRWLIAASEPAAVLRHGAVTDELDERAAVRFLAFRFDQSERSFFRQIQEMPPAHRLRVTARGHEMEQYWRFRLHGRGGQGSRERVETAFRTHLRRSVADQVAGLQADRIGLSLSGGLDSSTLAALAPAGVRAFSWYFEDASECDERRSIEAIAGHLGRRVHWVRGDGLYPLSGDYVDRFVNENSPHLNAFAALKSRLYEAARAEGCRRIMVGDGGDAIYSAQQYWLRDALASGSPDALASLFRTIAKAARGEQFARLALRRLLPIGNDPSGRERRPPPWLTDVACSRLPERALSPVVPEARRQHRYSLIVGARHTELESEEQRLFARCGIGRSNPFWYWPLLQMVIHLPAWWFHRDGRSKLLTRGAMRGLLPAETLESGRVGLLGALFLRGIESRRRQILETVFRQPRSDWRRYVRPSWLEPYLEATRSIQFGHTILWRVISYELWHRRLIRRP